MENWLMTDETQEAILALQLTREQLSHLASSGSHHYWNWVIVGLHHALQSFMVLALSPNNYLNVLTEKDAKAELAGYQQGHRKYSEPKLDKFINLYKKIKSDRMKIYIDSKPFNPNHTQDRSVEKLNALRNDFIHFVPKSWAIEVNGLLQIAEDCINIIAFLAFESGNVAWHDVDLKEQTQDLVRTIGYEIAKIKQVYNGSTTNL
jgi:hypothetical protein